MLRDFAPVRLARQGAAARRSFSSLKNKLLARRNAFGLLSEDIHPETGALWGNLPQSYTMAGIINSAMRLSVRWEDVWCRVSS